MQTHSAVQRFTQIFHARLSRRGLNRLHRRHCRLRRRPRVSFADLLLALVYHAVMGQGRIENHLFEQTGELLSAPAISQRRQRLPWQLFRDLMAAGLQPQANRRRHPEAFYHGYRLVGLDGTCFGVHNVPRLVSALGKASSRRFKAAFALVRTVVLVELGLHNPIAAAIGREGESEMALAWGLIEQLPSRSLLLADRLYGTPLFIGILLARCLEVHGEFLVRIRRRLKTRLIEVLPDGSAVVELRVPCDDGQPCTFLVREIRGRVSGRGSKVTSLRLWTSLLDSAAHPAAELLALYAQRWEVELTIKELKVEVHGGDRLASYTVDTAAQEIAALLLAQAVLAEARVLHSYQSKVAVLRSASATWCDMSDCCGACWPSARAGKAERKCTVLFDFMLDRSGTSILKLQDALRVNGVSGVWRTKQSVEDIAAATANGNPAIALVRTTNQTGHFVVVDGITSRAGQAVVAIRDPAGNTSRHWQRL